MSRILAFRVRPAYVTFQLPVVHRVNEVEAEGARFHITIREVVARLRAQAGPRAFRGQSIAAYRDDVPVCRRVTGDLGTAQRLLVVKFRVEHVDAGSQVVIRSKLEDTENAIARQFVRLDERLDAVDVETLVAIGIGDITVSPDVDVLFLDRLEHARVT